jgi:hypothetical protein
MKISLQISDRALILKAVWTEGDVPGIRTECFSVRPG